MLVNVNCYGILQQEKKKLNPSNTRVVKRRQFWRQRDLNSNPHSVSYQLCNTGQDNCTSLNLCSLYVKES